MSIDLVREPGYGAAWQDAYGLDGDPVRRLLVYPAIREMAGSLHEHVVADLGSGNGNLMHFLKDESFLVWTMLERDKEFLSAARNNLRGDTRARFIEQDLNSDLSLPFESIDTMFCIFVLNELQNIERLLSSAKLALKSDGQFIAIMSHPSLCLYYMLREQFGGIENDKIVGISDYFDTSPGKYIFSLSTVTATFYQHTFEYLTSTFQRAGFMIEKMVELRTNDRGFKAYATYWNSRDFPKYLGFRLVPEN